MIYLLQHIANISQSSDSGNEVRSVILYRGFGPSVCPSVGPFVYHMTECMYLFYAYSITRLHLENSPNIST